MAEAEKGPALRVVMRVLALIGASVISGCYNTTWVSMPTPVVLQRTLQIKVPKNAGDSPQSGYQLIELQYPTLEGDSVLLGQARPAFGTGRPDLAVGTQRFRVDQVLVQGTRTFSAGKTMALVGGVLVIGGIAWGMAIESGFRKTEYGFPTVF